MAGQNNDYLFPITPELPRQMIGNRRIPKWDHFVPSMYRLLSGSFTSTDTTTRPGLSVSEARDDQESLSNVDQLRERITRQRFLLIQHELEAKASVQRAITAVSSINSDLPPLEALRIHIGAFFTSGPSVASFIVANLHDSVKNRSTKLSPGTWNYSNLEQTSFLFPWASCKLTASLVLIAASPKHKMYDALRSQSHRLGGLPTLVKICNTPSASFRDSFTKAKIAAENHGQTTIIGVWFTDVHIFRLAQANNAHPWSSFAHTFVMGVEPAGVTIWQAWGEHGYRLDEYIERGGARVRSWDEAAQFVLDFERLAIATGGWNSKKNKWYKRCFEVDINQVCGPDGLQNPIVPKYEAWVRLQVIHDVKVENIKKFNWE